jgi:hypothetical protein
MRDLADWRVAITIACLLLAMLISAWIGWKRWAGPVVLTLLSVAWISTLDKQFEGPVLWHLRPRHGIVLSDLAGIAGLLVAALLAARLLRRSRREYPVAR